MNISLKKQQQQNKTKQNKTLPESAHEINQHDDLSKHFFNRN